MNFKEACSTLGIAPDASADEAKKKYRELTKKYHPDVNKASDAEEKFKKINEAYQRFQNGDTPEPSPMSGGWVMRLTHLALLVVKSIMTLKTLTCIPPFL